MSEPWGPGPGPPAPGPGYPYPGYPHPSYGYGPPARPSDRGGTRCAVLAPVLLLLSVVPLVLSPFLLLIGVFSAASPGSGGGWVFVVALLFLALAGGLWVGSVVCSVIGLARARGGYRWSAAISLAFAVGTIPVLSLLSSLHDLS